MDAGTPEDVHELRVTDVDEAKARQRYAVFKQHYGTLLRLKQYFPFSLIDGAHAYRRQHQGLATQHHVAGQEQRSLLQRQPRRWSCTLISSDQPAGADVRFQCS